MYVLTIVKITYIFTDFFYHKSLISLTNVISTAIELSTTSVFYRFLNVLDEVMLSMSDDEENQVTAEQILMELNIENLKQRHPMSLSGGQQQRVAIASAVASRREIMVFDEPTSGLDFRHMEEVATVLEKLQQMGKTLFIITHDPELIQRCCDYFLFIENGKIKWSEQWNEHSKNELAAFFGEDF